MSYNHTGLEKEIFDDSKSNKIKESLESNLEISKKNTQLLQNQYDQLQLDKEKKIQNYRDMLLKLNKEKRHQNKIKEVEPSVINLFIVCRITKAL